MVGNFCPALCVGFVLMTFLGCAPDQLTEAGKCFSRENYTGVVRELNKYLNNVDSAKTEASEADVLYHTAASFKGRVSE